MPQYVYPGDLLANTLAQASDVNSRVTGLAASVNNVDGTQLLAGVVALTHLTPTLAAMVVQAGALPASPSAYQPWVDTADKRLKVYNGSTWDKYAAETMAQIWADQQTFLLPIAAPVNPNLLPNPTGAQGLAYWSQGGGPPNQWAPVVSFATSAGPVMFQSGTGSLAATVAMTLASAQIKTGASTPVVLSGQYRANTGAGADVVYSASILAYNASGTLLQTASAAITADGTNRSFQASMTTPANTVYCVAQLGIVNNSSTTAETFENFDVWGLKLEVNVTAPTMFTDDQANPDTLMAGAGGRFEVAETMFMGSVSTSSASNVSVASLTLSGLQEFFYSPTRWANNSFYIRATMQNATAGDVAYIGIWNVSTGAPVSGSEVSITGGPGIVEGPKVALTPNQSYCPYLRAAAGTAELYAAAIVAAF